MTNPENIKIIIAAHKPYRMPEGLIYLPVHVGAAGKDEIDFQKASARDDSGENISVKNPYYCELTGLYWAWKNLDADWIGLAHYRRHFSSQKGKDIWDSVLKDDEMYALADSYDIILPAKRRYYIETLYSHYAHTHEAKHLDLTGEIIREICPEYTDFYEKVLKQTGGYMFNMFIMRRPLLEEYCSFLFPIMERLEAVTSTDELSAFNARFYGRVSEILFNVWLSKKMAGKNPPRTKAIGLVYMEPVNWFKKGTAFLKAKFFRKKYDKSF